MIKDEIVEETRRLRDQYAKQFDYDLRKIYEDLKNKRKMSGTKYVSFADDKAKAKKVKETKKAA